MNPSRPILTLTNLLKGALMVSVPSLLILLGFAWAGKLAVNDLIYGGLGILVASLAFVVPFLSNVASLSQYVNDLALDKRVRAPQLSVFGSVGAFTDALSRLQRSWEEKKQQMETIITEREILVDTLPDILVMTNDDKVIVRTNRAARMIFGQNLAGKPLRDVIPNEALLHAISAVIQDLKGYQIEFTLEQPVVADYQATIERFPIPSDSGITIVITLNDITAQKRIQRMRADFVANASHEIRTPLASIIGFIETLRGPAKDDPIAREEFLKVMADQSERMSKLISDLLSLSKIEMNAHTEPTGKVDMLRVIRGEKQHFEWACKQKNVTIRLKLHDQLPLTRGEESELAHVVRNLLSNAVKYTNPDTEVIVTAKVTSSLPNDPILRELSRAIVFSVRDHGEGISKEHLPRLTERFYRVDSARTRKVGGTGLGLAIVKHVLNRHHGTLVVESEVGQGSTFMVYLPLYDDVANEVPSVLNPT